MPIELGSFSIGTVAGGAVGAIIVHYFAIILIQAKPTTGKKSIAT